MTSELVRIDTNHLTLNKMEKRKRKRKRQKGIHTETIEARG
jgi:hypothetical protein